MAIRVALNHKTTYRYDRSVHLSPQIVRLRPAPHCRTPILSYSLTVKPSAHFLNWQQDPQSNYLARLTFPDQTRRFEIEVDLIADMTVINPFDFFLEPSAMTVPFRYDPWLEQELRPFLEVEPAGTHLRRFLAGVSREETGTADFLVGLNRRVRQEVDYIVRMKPGIQSCEESLSLRRGSCRDSAWLLAQILRHLGLAARFASGYLIQLTADEKPLDGPDGPEQDFTDLHAWTEVYLPGAGWVGLDPTSGLLTGEGHIPLACTPQASSAAPITGAVEPCNVEFDVAISVARVHEDPRVTKPYTDEQWQEIETLGQQVDAAFAAGDVRLTMGGEPTFVSIDDMEGEEWNTAAVGPTKRQRAAELLKRLKARFAAGGLLHYGQGKWYPNESLPRWDLACYWRADGVPMWRDDTLIADENVKYGHTARDAHTFITALADRLDVDERFVLPAYEDVWQLLGQERRLPVNLDPLHANLDDPEERQRLTRAFERGLGEVIGYVLPLERRLFSPARWVTGPWEFRTSTLFLYPGDSPIGLRLPLDTLPWIPSNGQRNELAPRTIVAAKGWVADDIHTALCVEPRQGRLYVFIPPMRELEDYLDLVSALEATAEQLKTPIVIEGYEPPTDHRIRQLKVTPAPGVIEVHMPPAHSWTELVTNTTGLNEAARQARLGTEKFMVDGKHTGTGGGNHVTLGGPTPADSPILRRPDLLRSLVAYWNNHPALSYVFSGIFIGPTSQAPRVDEGRHDNLYELEIAFQQLPGPEEACPPWLVDRLFRHLLVDVTGNTHRAEFCIDKLYAPESSSGRLGLVKIRAFEMPPHVRMSLTQQVLLRALIARFWTTPYAQALVHWGTALHDRFMLPHVVKADFAHVLADLQEAGYAFKIEWFAPHFEFRFPFYGRVSHADMTLELRAAIEPWNVFGEEPGAAGTVCFVDSSVERLQVIVTGMTETRYVVTCNGRRLPLHATGTAHEFVAGVRYRAWQPPSCLHPTIPVHAPLVFDMIDTWNTRSIGGCVYHVAHPGGRTYDTFPVNAYEAESRRVARFSPFGHTPGPREVPPEETNPQFPYTLDLRRHHPKQSTIKNLLL